MTDYDYKQIAHFKKGETLFTVGDPSDVYYFLIKGNIDLKSGGVEGDSIADEVKPGDFCGALSFYADRPRDKTALATSDCIALKIDNDSFASFLRKEPERISELLEAFALSVHKANETFLEAQAGAKGTKVVGGTQFQLIESESNPIIYTDRKYALLLPPQHDQFMFTKEVNCPVCDHTFKTNQIRQSKVELDRIDDDFRRRYMFFDELWYSIWICPNCGYAQFYNDFFKLNVKVTTELEFQLRSYKTLLRENYIKHSINEVFQEFYYLNRIYEHIKPNPYQQARLWQGLAWLYEDVSDAEAVWMAKNQVKRNLENGYFKSKLELPEDEEIKLMIKLGLLSDALGDTKEGLNYLLRTAQMKDANKIYKQKAQDLILQLKQKVSRNRTAEGLTGDESE